MPTAVVVGTDLLADGVEIDGAADALPFPPPLLSLRSTSRHPPSRATSAASGPQPVTAVTSLRASLRTVSSEKASIDAAEPDSSSSSEERAFLPSLVFFLSLSLCLSAGGAEGGVSEGGVI